MILNVTVQSTGKHAFESEEVKKNKALQGSTLEVNRRLDWVMTELAIPLL